MEWGESVSSYHVVANKWVKGTDFHTKSLGYARHVASHLAISVDSQSLVFQLCARSAVVAIANQRYKHTKHQLCHSVAVLARSVHHAHAISCRLGQVDVVVSGTSTHHYLELWGCVEHLFVHLIAAHYQSGTVGHGFNHVVFRAFFHEHHFVTGGL